MRERERELQPTGRRKGGNQSWKVAGQSVDWPGLRGQGGEIEQKGARREKRCPETIEESKKRDVTSSLVCNVRNRERGHC